MGTAGRTARNCRSPPEQSDGSKTLTATARRITMRRSVHAWLAISAVLLLSVLRSASAETKPMPAADKNPKTDARADGKDTDKAKGKPAPDAKHQHVKGRVLGPAGESVAGATVYA